MEEVGDYVETEEDNLLVEMVEDYVEMEGDNLVVEEEDHIEEVIVRDIQLIEIPIEASSW